MTDNSPLKREFCVLKRFVTVKVVSRPIEGQTAFISDAQDRSCIVVRKAADLK